MLLFNRDVVIHCSDRVYIIHHKLLDAFAEYSKVNN